MDLVIESNEEPILSLEDKLHRLLKNALLGAYEFSYNKADIVHLYFSFSEETAEALYQINGKLYRWRELKDGEDSERILKMEKFLKEDTLAIKNLFKENKRLIPSVIKATVEINIDHESVVIEYYSDTEPTLESGVKAWSDKIKELMKLRRVV
jgi:hypothetical protein